MEIKGDELVYNRGALGSAKAYAEKNGEKEVLEKLKKIYEHLELDFEAKFDCDCEEFCDLYEEDIPCGDDCDDCSLEKHEEEVVVEEPNEEPAAEPVVVVEKVYTEEEYKAMCDELTMKCHEAEGRCAEAEAKYSELEAKCCEFENKCGEYEGKCAEFEKQCADYEKRCAELEEKCANCEEVKKSYSEILEKLAVQKVKEQKDYIVNACKKMSISDVSKNALVEKCERREYETIEDIDRELAYIDFKKKKTSLMKEDSVYCVNVVSEDKIPVVEKFRSKNNLSIEERLKKNIKSKK